MRWPHTILFPEIKQEEIYTQWDSLQILFLTFEIFAQFFLKCMHFHHLQLGKEKREKRKNQNKTNPAV